MVVATSPFTRRGLLASPFVALGAAPANAQQRVVEELHGTLERRTFQFFERFVFDRMDRVIGLKINAIPSDHASGFSLGASGGQFVVYTVGGGSEIVASSGFSYQHGTYVFDGFFIPKNGGLHQGIVSAGLESVPEAQVRLARGISIRRATLR